MADIHRRWSEEESVLLGELAGSSSLTEMVDALAEKLASDRTAVSVRLQCRKLNIKPRDTRHENYGRLSAWSVEQVAELRDLASEFMASELAEHFGVNEKAIRELMYRHKIPGRGRSSPKPESVKEKQRQAAQNKTDAMYPPGGPWTCFRCKSEKPLDQFRPNQNSGHVCIRCMRSDRLEAAYGITIEDYEEVLEAQGGVCAICKKPETSTNAKTGLVYPLAQDHNHSCCPGKKTCGECRRGLLCTRCNNVLEVFERGNADPMAFLRYLETYA